MRKRMRMLLEKYFIIPNIKISLFREFFIENIEIANHEIVFIGEINDYRMIRGFLGKKMYFIDYTKVNGQKKIKRVSDYYYIITSDNYLQWITDFGKKEIENWAVIPLYDVRFSI